MRYVSLVFIYMRANPISNVFLATNTRMRNILCVLLLSLDYIAMSLLLFCYFAPFPFLPLFLFSFRFFSLSSITVFLLSFLFSSLSPIYASRS